MKWKKITNPNQYHSPLKYTLHFQYYFIYYLAASASASASSDGKALLCVGGNKTSTDRVSEQVVHVISRSKSKCVLCCFMPSSNDKTWLFSEKCFAQYVYCLVPTAYLWMFWLCVYSILHCRTYCLRIVDIGMCGVVDTVYRHWIGRSCRLSVDKFTFCRNNQVKMVLSSFSRWVWWWWRRRSLW